MLFALITLMVSCNKPEKPIRKAAPKNFRVSRRSRSRTSWKPQSPVTRLLLAIFGPDSKDVLFSGDAVKDKNYSGLFVTAYEQMHRWVKSKPEERC